MHGAVLLDAREQLRPGHSGNDGRSAPQCQQLTRIVPSLHDITGNLGHAVLHRPQTAVGAGP